MSAGPADPSRGKRVALGAALALLAGLAASLQADPIPAGQVWIHKEQNNWVHIYKSADYDKTPAADRSVLLLGLNSTDDVVKLQSGYVNPATGKPYDAVIGLAAPGTWDEWKRVVWKDHFDASENAGAVGAAVAKAFGGKVEAGNLDMHSNGNAVGMALLERNIGFSGVTKLNMMAPDEGVWAKNLDPERLSKIVANQGIEDIEVFVNNGDIVPAAGAASKAARDWTVFENVSAKGIPLRRHEFDYDSPVSLNDHYLATYLVLRALESGDPDVISKMRLSVGEQVFQLVVGVVRPSGKFGQRISSGVADLEAQKSAMEASVKEAEGILGRIKAYRAKLVLPGDQALSDSAGVLQASDQVSLERLSAKSVRIEQALACLAQIAARPPVPFVK